ncbi:Txe/YoeB family addiction module toxin [Pseudomonas saliphila]|uniref:Txe/YoeB family addiction module toxin n=1 Tax=Pseudomonas saliphila TaxID=2586906 RepID=UPI00123953CA|nr:Txe/YoeB family addiction module toxin [Pseudomonas saliphila]
MSNKKKQATKLAVPANAIKYSLLAWEDYLYWKVEDTAVSEKIDTLIKDCLRHPFEGLGKPEPLKGDYSGFWSRRINREHRFVYQLKDGTLHVVQCRYHYDN